MDSNLEQKDTHLPDGALGIGERARMTSAGVTRGTVVWVRSSFQEVGEAMQVRVCDIVP